MQSWANLGQKIHRKRAAIDCCPLKIHLQFFPFQEKYLHRSSHSRNFSRLFQKEREKSVELRNYLPHNLMSINKINSSGIFVGKIL